MKNEKLEYRMDNPTLEGSDRYFMTVRWERFMSEDKEFIEKNYPDLPLEDGAKRQLAGEIQEVFDIGYLAGFYEVTSLDSGEPDVMLKYHLLEAHSMAEGMLESAEGAEEINVRRAVLCCIKWALDWLEK